jgi:hypothetical protein
MPKPVETVHRLLVRLRNVEPAVWRHVEIESGAKLPDVSRALLTAMGWTDSHLHAFRAGAHAYGTVDPDFGLDILDERDVGLGKIAPVPKSTFGFEYDFGDGWEHDVSVDAIYPAELDATYPRCLAGKNACPPEDCGGPPGYESLLEILADPKHPEYKQMRMWAGKFDPAAFDLRKTNVALARLAPRGPRLRVVAPKKLAFSNRETDDVLAMLFGLITSRGFQGTLKGAMLNFFGDFFDIASAEQADAARENEQTQIAFNAWFLFDAYITEDESGRLMDAILGPTSNARLTAGQRVFLERMAVSHMRPYVVRTVRRDEGLSIEGLWDGEKVDVSERAATHSLRPGQMLFGRVIEGGAGRPEFHGALLALGAQQMDALLAALRASLRGRKRKQPKLDDGEFFKQSGPRIMRAWLEQYLTPLPSLVTSDGHPLRPQYLVFDVLDHAALVQALKKRAEFDAHPTRPQFAWLDTSARNTAFGKTLLGDLDVGAASMTAFVASDERALALRDLLKRVAPSAVRYRRTEVHPLEGTRTADEEIEIPEGLRRELELRFQDEYDRAWLDMDVPALGGRTPRNAAKLKTQRKNVAALLKSFESNPGSRSTRDLTWMWEELKLTDLS